MNDHKCSVQGTLLGPGMLFGFLLLILIGKRGDVFQNQVILIKFKPGIKVQFVDAAFPWETPAGSKLTTTSFLVGSEISALQTI